MGFIAQYCDKSQEFKQPSVWYRIVSNSIASDNPHKMVCELYMMAVP